MPRFSSFLFGMVTGAALLYTAMTHHVLRAVDGWHLVSKQPARLSETYIDVRAFTVADWASHPTLAAALVQADKQHLLGGADSARRKVEETIQQGLDHLLPSGPAP